MVGIEGQSLGIELRDKIEGQKRGTERNREEAG